MVEANANSQLCPDTLGYPCEVCDQGFRTKIGRSQHVRQMHKAEYNAVVSATAPSRRLWSLEERRILAALEIEAVEAGVTGSLDRHLATLFTSRTYDSIKGQRKLKPYERILTIVKAERAGRIKSVLALNRDVSNVNQVETADTPSNPGGSNDHSTRAASPDPNRFKNALLEEINETLVKLNKRKSPIASQLASAVKVFLRSANQERRMYRIMEWLNKTLDRNPNGGNRPRNGGSSMLIKKGNRRSRVRQEYAILQKLYKRSTRRAFEYVIDPKGSTDNSPSFTAEMFEFWKNIYEGGDHLANERTPEVEAMPISETAADCIWAPITADDVEFSELERTSAAGPDGVSVKQWRSITYDQRSIVYNVLMLHGHIDPDLLRARTIFIPKVDRPETPDKFRPIGITSVIIRQLHRIFAKRLRAFRGYDDRQKAFCNVDGVAENLLLLKALMDDAQREQNELHIVSIDIRKAFDSVSHSSILSTMTRLACPRPFVEYVKWVYDHATTNLHYGGHKQKVKVLKGVLQGDPLSPVVFNYLIDRALGKLDDSIGYSLKHQRVNCMAFADDIILISGSVEGMKHNLKKLVGSLTEFGLDVNIQKSHAMSLIPDGKRKKTYVSETPSFEINGIYLRQLGVNDQWTYLGVRFEGSQAVGDVSSLTCQLKKIGKAHLKPQQKYLLLRNHLIPKFQHGMVLGKTSKNMLESLDIEIRQAMRAWMKFPHDTPIAYFHAKVKIGGLSIPSLSLDIPQMRLARMEKMVERGCPFSRAVAKTAYYRTTSTNDRMHLKAIVGEVGKEEIAKYWEAKLNGMIDTKDLAQSKYCPVANSFIWSNAAQWSGRHYVNLHRIRIGCLPTRSRRNRGRDGEALCRAGCGKSESNYHVIQQCSRTRGGRSLRHNGVVSLLQRELSKRNGLQVFSEPRIVTAVGLRKPDLIMTDGETATVIDVHIVSGHDMAADRSDKIQKYQGIPGFDQQVMNRYYCSASTEFEAITMSYKGIFEKTSAMYLQKLKITKQTLRRMSASVLFGSWMNWCCFNTNFWRRPSTRRG